MRCDRPHIGELFFDLGTLSARPTKRNKTVDVDRAVADGWAWICPIDP